MLREVHPRDIAILAIGGVDPYGVAFGVGKHGHFIATIQAANELQRERLFFVRCDRNTLNAAANYRAVKRARLSGYACARVFCRPRRQSHRHACESSYNQKFVSHGISTHPSVTRVCSELSPSASIGIFALRRVQGHSAFVPEYRLRAGYRAA